MGNCDNSPSTTSPKRCAIVLQGFCAPSDRSASVVSGQLGSRLGSRLGSGESVLSGPTSGSDAQAVGGGFGSGTTVFSVRLGSGASTLGVSVGSCSANCDNQLSSGGSGFSDSQEQASGLGSGVPGSTGMPEPAPGFGGRLGSDEAAAAGHSPDSGLSGPGGRLRSGSSGFSRSQRFAAEALQSVQESDGQSPADGGSIPAAAAGPTAEDNSKAADAAAPAAGGGGRATAAAKPTATSASVALVPSNGDFNTAATGPPALLAPPAEVMQRTVSGAARRLAAPASPQATAAAAVRAGAAAGDEAPPRAARATADGSAGGSCGDAASDNPPVATRAEKPAQHHDSSSGIMHPQPSADSISSLPEFGAFPVTGCADMGSRVQRDTGQPKDYCADCSRNAGRAAARPLRVCSMRSCPSATAWTSFDQGLL